MTHHLRTAALLAALAMTAACTGAGPAPSAAMPPTALAGAGAAAATVGENALPGSDWQLHRRSVHGEVQGFASRTSVRRGEPVTLYVSTTAPTYVVRAFRMGWYGGRQARQVWASGPLPGRHQTGTRTVAATHTVSAHWRPGPTLDTSSWPAGDYLLRLDAANGFQRFVPLAVRSGSAAGKVVLVEAVTTWQAYSDWGGYTLYRGPHGGFADRARAVSFDRPYDDSSSVDRDGAGQFPHRELPAVALAEQLGLPLEYVTDVDLHDDPHLLDGAQGVVTMGHDEYWSVPMRAAVQRARDAGVDVAFLGANAVYRRIRLSPSPVGPDRVEINYKAAGEDPVNDAPDTTADWPSAPDARNESSFSGRRTTASRRAPGRRSSIRAAGCSPGPACGPGHTCTCWSGRRPTAYGCRRPRRARWRSSRTRRCPAGHRATTSDVTWYTTPSGAGVFDAGTIDWVCSITGAHCKGGGGATSRVVRAVTANLLRAFAAGRAGLLHPARDDVARVLA